jgi:hypothetical protein
MGKEVECEGGSAIFPRFLILCEFEVVSTLRSRFREVGHFFQILDFNSWRGVSGLRSRFREVGHLL